MEGTRSHGRFVSRCFKIQCIRFDFTSTLRFCPQGAYFSGDSARPELHIEATSLQSKKIIA